MRNWLARVSLDVFSSNSIPPKKKLCSALTILCCLYMLREDNYVRFVEENVYICLLRMVALAPGSATDYQYLLGMMQQEGSRLVILYAYMKCRFYQCTLCLLCLLRELAVESLTHTFASIADRKKTSHTIHLLQALPLIHFLRKDSSPNETRLLAVKEAVYNDPFLHFTVIHQTMDHSKSGYEECNC